MVKRHPIYLDETDIYFSCISCHSQLISQEYIVSKAFQGIIGPAYLVKQAVNVITGNNEERMLMTGIHTVADIYCGICKLKLGWKYIKAPVSNQKYKEGKYIIEKMKVVKEDD
ncbi:yippee-like protein [Pilobolus umbonatus]|nr:yippee-like protein [Pilobolus umbonatus]